MTSTPVTHDQARWLRRRFLLMAPAVALPLVAAAPTLNAAEDGRSQAALLGYASVLQFGARGDDSHDDTSSIQAALDAGLGPVFLPAKVYKISATLRVPSGSGLVGPGILHQTADVTTIMNAHPNTGNTDILLQDFTIKKDFVNNSLARGILVEHATELRIIGIEITGMSARAGIEVILSSNFVISECYLHDFHADAEGTLADGDPVSIDSIWSRSSSNGQIVNNRVENMVGTRLQSDGIYASDSRYLVIVGNRITNVGEGIDLGHTHNSTVTGNVVAQATIFGLKLVNGAKYNTISGNTVTDAGDAGIEVARANHLQHGYTEGNVISGNTVLNVGSNGLWPLTARAGIKLEGDRDEWLEPRHNVVIGNLLFDNQETKTMQYGILEDDFAVDNLFLGNKAVGYSVQEIRLHP